MLFCIMHTHIVQTDATSSSRHFLCITKTL